MAAPPPTVVLVPGLRAGPRAAVTALVAAPLVAHRPGERAANARAAGAVVVARSRGARAAKGVVVPPPTRGVSPQ